MLFTAERHHLVNLIKRMQDQRLLDGGGGAVSLRTPDGNILMNVTGCAARNWEIDCHDFIVLRPDGSVVERTNGAAAAGVTVHLAIYCGFAACNGIVHAHAPYSLSFAALGASIPATTSAIDKFGDIPCLIVDDEDIKRRVALGEFQDVPIPPGAPPRRDVTVINNVLSEQMMAAFGARQAELERHGLAFTVWRHGQYAMARTVEEAADVLSRVEAAARTALYCAILESADSHNELTYRVPQPARAVVPAVLPTA